MADDARRQAQLDAGKKKLEAFKARKVLLKQHSEHYLMILSELAISDSQTFKKIVETAIK